LVAAVLFLIAGLGVIWWAFMAADHRRHQAERDQLEREHLAAVDAAKRALRDSRRGRDTVN
jgi:hypothetical protein